MAVMAVANGLEAWKVLIDVSKQIDLVLTEVVMPYLSGIGLLTKIMNNVTRKNIPVISEYLSYTPQNSYSFAKFSFILFFSYSNFVLNGFYVQ